MFVEYGQEQPRARVNAGDAWIIQLRPGNTLLAGKVLRKRVMFEAAELFVLYDMRFDEDESSKVILEKVGAGGPVLMAPLLVSVDMVRSGFVRKIGKATVSDEELASVRMISTVLSNPYAPTDNPLEANFDPKLGSYVMNDRSLEPEHLVDWEGNKASPIPGQPLGRWGSIPNAAAYEERLLKTLAARRWC
ncbi:hypothetical protein [Tsukamurella pulmonis]|uniref:hypothetical protein n=1 Tax=Tsukamurella pulmonis TaxID=47312 RepID=UPI0011140D07|nr:hypothetical protein [Tsukamurella pulmonis]